MSIVLSTILLAGISFALGIPVFVGVGIALLFLPLFVVQFYPFIGFYPACMFSLGLCFSVLKLIIRQNRRPFSESGFPELLLLVPVYWSLRVLIDQWPEFYNLGEHIRDFAVLSAVTRNPNNPAEPWCDSLSLNYYTYWYRFAFVFKQFFSLSTASVYHSLMSFALSYLFVLLLRLGRIGLELNSKQSFFLSLAVCFGSNVAGLLVAISGGFWWSPSRVFQAGITEFPVWSFVLGDLHPHYLSLVLLPLFLLIPIELGYLLNWTKRSFLLLVALSFAASALVFTANSWDLVCYALAYVPFVIPFFGNKQGEDDSEKEIPWLAMAFSSFFGILALLFIPKLGNTPIQLRFVTSLSPQVSLSEFLSHWGFQFMALLLGFGSYLIRKQRWVLLTLSCFAFLGVSWLNSPLGLIITTLLLLLLSYRKEKTIKLDRGLILGALLIMGFQEVFFFDDPYGGQTDRLNTIFKLTFFCWVPFSVGAWSLLLKELIYLPENFRLPSVKVPVALATAVLFLAFFLHVAFGNGGRKVILASYESPRGEGLSSQENLLAGSAKVINRLRQLPPNLRVLEWASPAYSDAANICSLSEHNCYIGWRNHLMIQYKEGLEEYNRREGILNKIYSSGPCEERKMLSENEQIGAVIMGPREKAERPELSPEVFRCFRGSETFGSITLYYP